MGVSILLADDHNLFAVGIKRILDFIPGCELVGSVQNGREVILFLESNQKVDVLVLDLHMPVMDGMQLLPHLSRKFPDMKTMILSGHHTKGTLEACKNLGAKGFVGKDSCFEIFREALEVIAGGGEYFQPVSITKNIYNGHWNCLYQKLRAEYGLSDRETEILKMILNQSENKEIAQQLNLSPLTVKTHRKNIYKKLHVHNISGLLGLIKEHPGL
ncbi:response regulator [Cognataquiflexum rubidum]|uniref:response regulator n=1 Tax=Cognataquiflexum rubidum TaxID=2922273 RepID=UPI001F135B87|nr:response regulator transcription factor [Cognataquiflexum rubidum]MCH6235052.1 response regulator transcription factor [Cognataquiflexum rubidum]